VIQSTSVDNTETAHLTEAVQMDADLTTVWVCSIICVCANITQNLLRGTKYTLRHQTKYKRIFFAITITIMTL